MALRLTNTLGGEVEDFRPLQAGKVRMYHCGPTVKESINLDKFRSFLLGDVLRRYFELAGLDVTQVMNITDVGHLNEFEQDAIEIAAGRAGKQPLELVEEEESEFHRHRHELRILDAHQYPRARENVAEMIAFVEELLAAGHAYRAGDNVYFDITHFPAFGKLTGNSIDELGELQKSLAAAPHPEKRNPLDFDLWRTDVLHSSHWPSPWGRGFPGWHVECVVMGRKHLGKTFDIHTGSHEIIYPHHECEIAEAEVVDGTPLARYWLHSEHVCLDGKPISRANQNYLTVQGLLDSDIAGVDIRGALIRKHYRSPIELTPDALEDARLDREAIQAAWDALRDVDSSNSATGAERGRLEDFAAAFRAALENDLDLDAAFSRALELAGAVTSGELSPSTTARSALGDMDRVLAILD